MKCDYGADEIYASLAFFVAINGSDRTPAILLYFENSATMRITTIRAIYTKQPMLNDFSALAKCFFADSMSPRSNASRAACLSSMENQLPPLNQKCSVALCSSISALTFMRASSRSSLWQRFFLFAFCRTPRTFYFRPAKGTAKPLFAVVVELFPASWTVHATTSFIIF